MKNVKIYAVLRNGRTGGESHKTELHTARIDDEGRISAAVYDQIKRKTFKLGPAPKGSYWALETEDGRRDTFGGYPCPISFVRFSKEAN